MALESLGCGFDVASDFRLKFVKKCPHEHGGKLVVLYETRKRDIVLPGGGVVCDVVEDIKCDKGYINTLNPEELIPIMEKLENRNDKRSLCQVSKEFLRARCITLRRFRSLVPSLLEVVLPASPNLLRFCSPIPLQNSHLKLLAQSCPKLEELWLDREMDLVPQPVDVDFDDNGVSELAVCNNLEDVDFSGRINVGDFGVVSLVRSCLNLQSLTLEGCLRITDEALKSIAELTKLSILNLKNCSLITNIGLKYLANGETKNCLNDLVLANCGTNITDVGIVSLSEIRFLSLLDTSMLANVSDASLVEISSKCTKMRQLYLNGCVAITGKGLRAFTDYGNISELCLVNCPNISWEDVVSIGCTFEMLESLHLDRRMQNPMPAAGLEQDFEFGGREPCQNTLGMIEQHELLEVYIFHHHFAQALRGFIRIIPSMYQCRF